MDKTYYANRLNADRLQRVYDLAGDRVRRYLRAEIDHLAGLITGRDRILELGCGFGRVLAPLAELAAESWGIDNSSANLDLTRRQHPQLNLALMDAAELGFPDDFFDLVFGVQNFISAGQVPPRDLVRESLRVTRPGGTAVFSSYAAQFWPHRLEWFRQQAAAGLLGEIDEAATGDGVIVCQDGFRATTLTPEDFRAVADGLGVRVKIYQVDGSSLFAEFEAPKRRRDKPAGDGL